ncbi:MAG: hypothetical protein PHP45_07450 [Elusimicrobiales bacterium]|nr:hypothetical protein [Elusimicrobiales bacterium]
MKRIIAGGAALAVLLLASSYARAGDFDIRLLKMVKAFSKTATDSGLGNTALAVFPYSADKKLSSRKINAACTEQLTTLFMADGNFKVLDSSQLAPAMENLKGGSAITASAAARLGKLAGARLAVSGSVSKLEGVYHLSTALINTETGEIIATDVTEIPVQLLEQDSARYAPPESDEPGTGFYLTYAGGPLKVKNLPPATVFGSNTITPTNAGADLMAAGVGARYFAWSNWMFDLTAFVHSELTPDAVEYRLNPPPPGPNTGPGQQASIRGDGPMARLTLNRTIHLFGPFRAIVGAGALIMSMKINQENMSNGGTGNGSVTVNYDGGEKQDYFTPTARLGLEWKIQRRLGLSVFGNYNFKKSDFTDTVRVSQSNNFQKVIVRQLEYPQFFVDAALCLYF